MFSDRGIFINIPKTKLLANDSDLYLQVQKVVDTIEESREWPYNFHLNTELLSNISKSK